MTEEKPPLVSIVIVSFRGGAMLKQCLDSLDKQDYPNTEIVVVDNGSGMNLRNAMSARKDSYRWVTEEQNLGFAGGCNRGIDATAGAFIALVNDDAVLEPSWVSEMVKCVTGDPKTGAVAGLVIDGNRPDVLDSFGVGVALDGMSRQLECGAPSNSPRNLKSVLAFSGCSCLLRRQALEDTGTFDEHFFAYCEDTDLSLRLLRAGWSIQACPTAKSVHYYSHTGGRFSLKKLYLIERNHQWVAFKNFPLLILALFPWMTLWRFMVQIAAAGNSKSPVAGFMSNGLFRTLITLAKADVSAAMHAPAILLYRVFGRYMQNKIGAWKYTQMLANKRMPVSSVLLTGSASTPEK